MFLSYHCEFFWESTCGYTSHHQVWDWMVHEKRRYLIRHTHTETHTQTHTQTETKIDTLPQWSSKKKSTKQSVWETQDSKMSAMEGMQKH